MSARLDAIEHTVRVGQDIRNQDPGFDANGWIYGYTKDVGRLAAALRAVLDMHQPCDNDATRTPICQTCHGKAGVWECGCWADEDREPVCSTCVGVEPVHNGHGAMPWPCPTVAAITAALDAS